ncbi:MAG: hypothetical protein WAL64_09395 [Candidatus Dormiibacterota bacterium]
MAAPPSPGLTPPPLFGAHPLQEGHTTLPGGHFSFALVPRQRISDGVVIENFSDHPLAFQIYGADLVMASGGGLTPAQPTATMHGVGAWIAVTTPTVTIAANRQFSDNFTVTAPSVVSPGQHLGAIVAAADVGTTPQGDTIEARVALIAVVTVPGSAHPSAALGSLTSSSATPGLITFHITLFNTGNLLLTYSGLVRVYDGAGQIVATLPLNPSAAYVVPDGRTPLAAFWKGQTPQSGNYSARATVTVFADAKRVATLTSKSLELSFSETPLMTIIGLGLLCGLILLVAAWTLCRPRPQVRRRIGPLVVDSWRSL